MADKYIIQGAAFNGDGTASSEAASAGAAGAWNTLNYMLDGGTPAFGSAPAAGDTVHMRSKTGNGVNANIVLTLAATKFIGHTNAVAGNRITWVLDNGVIWSGIDGTLTIECPSSFVVNFQNYNAFISRTAEAWTCKDTSANNKGWWSGLGLYVDGMFLDTSANSSGVGGLTNAQWGHSIFKNVHLKHNYRIGGALISSDYASRLVFVNPKIELLQQESTPIFLVGGSCIDVHGGKLYGTGADLANLRLCDLQSSGHLRTHGFRFPNTMIPNVEANTAISGGITANGCDGSAGSMIAEGWGRGSSRSDGYYPYLNAQMPASTPFGWSWWLYPRNALAGSREMRMSTSKLFTDTAATKTLTVEVLVSTTFTGINSRNLEVEFVYVDSATGDSKYLTTMDPAGGALTASTAAWSATTYGSVSFNKKKFTVTTPTPIKQDSMIQAILIGRLASSTANDVMIFDPDFSVT